MEKVRAHVVAEGRVQGVCFRSYTCDRAQKLKVFGWVRNLPDGRVEAIFEGERELVDKIVDWCHFGPPGAHVAGLKVDWLNYTGEFATFGIRY
jgi:acylphosphatase